MSGAYPENICAFRCIIGFIYVVWIYLHFSSYLFLDRLKRNWLPTRPRWNLERNGNASLNYATSILKLQSHPETFHECVL